MARANKGAHVLDDTRQQVITAVLHRPEYANVYWDFDKDTWALECEPCHIKGVPNEEQRLSLTDAKIKSVLVTVAMRHNQERHPWNKNEDSQ